MKTRMHTIRVMMLIWAMGWMGPILQADAQVPTILNYQGRVAVSGTNFTGAGQFKFALVNSAGSATYWSNGVNAVTTTVSKGLYSILLGDTNLSNMTALSSSVFTNNDVRLRVWFAPQGSTLQLLSPDQRLAAVGYALNADQMDGLHSSAFAQLSSSPTFTGTVHAAGFAGSGASLTSVNADQVDGLHAASFAQLSSSPTFTGTVHAAGFAGSGASLTNVNADQLDGQHGTYYLNFANMTGAVTDAHLSTNVALRNAVQTFSGENHFMAKVGIGVTNPQKRLEVRAQGSADGIRVDSGGYPPSIALSSNETIHGELGLAISGGNFSSDAAAGDTVLRNNSGKLIIQSGGGSSAIAISTNNYVGIHQANPSTAMDVNGTITARGIIAPAWGKSLVVGQNWGDGPFRVYGSTWTVDQQNPNFGYYEHIWSDWQSFTAGTNGTLAAIQAYVYSETGGLWTATLAIYAGEGTTGTVLSTQSIGGDGVNQARNFILETPVILVASNHYSYYIYNSTTRLTMRMSSDLYAGGRSGYSVSYDYHFITYMLQTSEVPALVIAPNTLNVGIGTDTPTNKLQVIGTVQATAYITGSDRDAKENVRPVDSGEILSGVTALPIASWNFKNDTSGPHIGPMAQDFHSAFGLGNTDSGIFTVDADGIALAAIQGLNLKLESELKAKEEQIEALESRIEQLERKLNDTK